MKVKYHVISNQRTFKKEAHMDFQGSVHELMELLYGNNTDEHLSIDELIQNSVILINQTDIRQLDGKDTHLTQDDQVTILPLLSGG